MIGHRLVGTSLLYAGEMVQSPAHYNKVLALYEPSEHRSLATRFGQDAKVATLSGRSLALWLLGYHEAALADAEHAVKDARQIGQAGTLMFALAHASWTYILNGTYAAANALLVELGALADEKAAFFWKASEKSFRGLLFAETGKTSDGIRLTTTGLSATRSAGANFSQPWALSCLAKAHAELGQFDEAWRSIDEARSLTEITKEKWSEAETIRVAGEIALRQTESAAANSQAYFERALSVARHNKQNPGNCAPP
jgi:tetratricopeptide (TPR) repeat protein